MAVNSLGVLAVSIISCCQIITPETREGHWLRAQMKIVIFSIQLFFSDKYQIFEYSSLNEVL